MADIGIAGSDTDPNKLQQIPYCELYNLIIHVCRVRVTVVNL